MLCSNRAVLISRGTLLRIDSVVSQRIDSPSGPRCLVENHDLVFIGSRPGLALSMCRVRLESNHGLIQEPTVLLLLNVVLDETRIGLAGSQIFDRCLVFAETLAFGARLLRRLLLYLLENQILLEFTRALTSLYQKVVSCGHSVVFVRLDVGWNILGVVNQLLTLLDLSLKKWNLVNADMDARQLFV